MVLNFDNGNKISFTTVTNTVTSSLYTLQVNFVFQNANGVQIASPKIQNSFGINVGGDNTWTSQVANPTLIIKNNRAIVTVGMQLVTTSKFTTIFIINTFDSNGSILSSKSVNSDYSINGLGGSKSFQALNLFQTGNIFVVACGIKNTKTDYINVISILYTYNSNLDYITSDTLNTGASVRYTDLRYNVASSVGISSYTYNPLNYYIFYAAVEDYSVISYQANIFLHYINTNTGNIYSFTKQYPYYFSPLNSNYVSLTNLGLSETNGCLYFVAGIVDYSSSTNKISIVDQIFCPPQPTPVPIATPTFTPTIIPTPSPTKIPTIQPSNAPTIRPSPSPSSHPSTQPTSIPSNHPSVQPSSSPSGQPNAKPTGQPSNHPSAQPSHSPSGQPNAKPTSQPSNHPSAHPSHSPSRQPSAQPTGQPSNHPSVQPSSSPSSRPSIKPTGQPSIKPTSQPSTTPTSRPSHMPSSNPSTQPTSIPSTQPSTEPTSQPSDTPTSIPTIKPTALPTAVPSASPTGGYLHNCFNLICKIMETIKRIDNKLDVIVTSLNSTQTSNNTTNFLEELLTKIDKQEFHYSNVICIIHAPKTTSIAVSVGITDSKCIIKCLNNNIIEHEEEVDRGFVEVLLPNLLGDCEENSEIL